MTESTALTTTTSNNQALAFLHDGAALDHRYRLAKAFSMSGMVPPHFQGKPEACLVAMLYAEQLGEHPMLLFQEMSVINGRPNTSSRFAISRANKSGLLQGPITWKSKGTGDALEVTASAVMKETGEVITATVTMKEAAADGWTRNPKYKSIPEQMLRWRAATRLINLYMPEVLFGLGVREEAEVRPVSVAEVPTTGGSVVAELNQKIIAGSTAATPDTDSGENLPVEQAEPAQNLITEVIADDPF
jgi:hypothetical protein